MHPYYFITADKLLSPAKIKLLLSVAISSLSQQYWISHFDDSSGWLIIPNSHSFTVVTKGIWAESMVNVVNFIFSAGLLHSVLQPKQARPPHLQRAYFEAPGLHARRTGGAPPARDPSSLPGGSYRVPPWQVSRQAPGQREVPGPPDGTEAGEISREDDGPTSGPIAGTHHGSAQREVARPGVRRASAKTAHGVGTHAHQHGQQGQFFHFSEIFTIHAKTVLWSDDVTNTRLCVRQVWDQSSV